MCVFQSMRKLITLGLLGEQYVITADFFICKPQWNSSILNSFEPPTKVAWLAQVASQHLDACIYPRVASIL